VIATLLGTALILTVALGVLGSAHAGNEYRVDVILDDAHGLIPGQLSEVAGAKVGTIESVDLTPDFKARVKLKVDGRFAPFHKDAHCTIRPQGLIAENYVNCDPGTPDSAAIKGLDGEAPTVPVNHTTAPVAVTDLFDVWAAPVRDRVTVLLSELGISTAGRGEDFNAILRRTNPSLALARKVIAILHRQRNQLTTVLDSADDVVGRLAAHKSSVADFIDQAGKVTSQTGAHSKELASAVNRLPALLNAADPALADLDTVVKTGTPLVKQLGVAAPAINRISNDIGPFARAAKPTLTQLRPVLLQGTATLKKAAPLSRLLKGYAHRSLPAAKIAGPLFTNLRDRGFVESLLSFIYGAAAGSSRFDGISHILPAFITLSACSVSSGVAVPGCSANYGSAAATKTVASSKKTTAKKQAPVRQPAASAPPAATAPKPAGPIGGVTSILDDLLHPKPGQSGGSTSDSVKGLLGYLLG
jgi:ABC-type transporter Mla subunit MlaD